LAARGDDDDALAAIARELAAPELNLVNTIYALANKVRILTRRAAIDEARAARDQLQDLVSAVPPSRVQFHLARSSASIAVAEGRLAAALADAELHEQAARDCGTWAIGIERCAWVEMLLDASLGLLASGGLSAHQRGRARRFASWLAAHGVLDSAC